MNKYTKFGTFEYFVIITATAYIFGLILLLSNRLTLG